MSSMPAHDQPSSAAISPRSCPTVVGGHPIDCGGDDRHESINASGLLGDPGVQPREGDAPIEQQIPLEFTLAVVLAIPAGLVFFACLYWFFMASSVPVR